MLSSKLLIITISALLVSFSFQELRELHHLNQRQLSDEPIYLPKKSSLKALSLGYENTLSHILWFQTINYFGKHYRGDKVYTWLEHMCSLSTAINENSKHIYEFCALMLSWEADKPKEAEAFLDNFIANYPNIWRPYYLQGMNAAIFLHDGNKAKEMFVKAANTEGAPVFLARLAAKKMGELEDPALAIAFLKSMIIQTKDESQVSALKHRLRELEAKLENKVEKQGN